MPENDPREARAGTSKGSLPGRLSALLHDLAHVPEAEVGAGWDLALEPGTVIGRFELLREVGRGGFGVVYEARDRDLGRKVAFKAVRTGPRLDVRGERLLREAEAAARLSHPNIVTLFDVGRSARGPYLVFELLRGRTLARRLGDGPVPTLEAVRIALEVAKGVAHAHANGVVHRDLAPGNVFLCDDGQVKLLDLGMAHAFGHPRLEGGTPGYMAPEQRRGEPEDERTDVFGVGVILHRMLTGQLPFAKDGDEARPVPARAIPGVPGLGELVARMLAADPQRRPRNGGEVVAALTPLLRDLETPPEWRAAARGRRRGRRAILAIVAGAGIAVTAAAAWLASRGAATVSFAPGAPAAVPSVAVLPFADLSPERDQEYFAEGLGDEIRNALGRVPGLRVLGRSSSSYFKDRPVALADIGRQLNVSTVLEGSVRAAGNRVRVTAEIVKVADGARVWSQSFDRELGDVLAVQNEIARAVVASLAVTSDVPPSSAPLATRDPEAYRQYLVGRHQYRRFSTDSLRLSAAAFERALALDPGYAPAWAGLALPAYFLAVREKTPAAVDAGRRRALAAAEKAVELAPDLPDGLSARALLRGTIEFDWRGAETDLERAIAVNGNDADVRRRHATLLAALGRLPDAIAEARRATELDPLSGSWGKLGLLHQAAGELDLAEAAFKRGREVWPDDLQIRAGYARNLLLASRPQEALAAFERCPDEVTRLWGTAVAKHALGDAAASSAALEALTSRYAFADAFEIALAHAFRGDTDAAFAWLERAVAARDGDLVGLRVDPFFARLRGDPRFAALLRRMNLPER